MLRKVLKSHLYLLIWVRFKFEYMYYWNIYKYIYIYPRGGRFTGNSCPVGVYIYMKLLRGWCYASSGVGWGGDDNVPCTCTHGRCYANIMFLALAHMVGATQHHVSCTCTHGWCYATSCFLHLHTWSVLRNIIGWGGDDNVPCTCTHGRCYATSYVSCTCTHGWCYATSCFLHLHTWLVLRNIMFLALAHMVGATQHHWVGWGWGGVGWGW